MENDKTETPENDKLPIFYDTPLSSVPETEYYDQWGNLKGTPAKTIEENHAENFVKIFIYQYSSINTVINHRQADFYFGFQLRIGKLVRQKQANIADSPCRSIESARIDARNMIIDICKKNRAIKKIFADFTMIGYDQLELF